MAFTWRYENTAGERQSEPLLEGAADHYVTQGDAESWLGEHWRALLDSGIEQVTLLEDNTVVYGPMSLRPAAS
jgi:hypothetical protein